MVTKRAVNARKTSAQDRDTNTSYSAVSHAEVGSFGPDVSGSSLEFPTTRSRRGREQICSLRRLIDCLGESRAHTVSGYRKENHCISYGASMVDTCRPQCVWLMMIDDNKPVWPPFEEDCGRPPQEVWDVSTSITLCNENHIPLRHWGVWTSSSLRSLDNHPR